jgi:hypothetical protein
MEKVTVDGDFNKLIDKVIAENEKKYGKKGSPDKTKKTVKSDASKKK